MLGGGGVRLAFVVYSNEDCQFLELAGYVYCGSRFVFLKPLASGFLKGRVCRLVGYRVGGKDLVEGGCFEKFSKTFY